MADADWTWRAELGDLLRTCRSRLARPAVPGSRRGGLRQEDVANLAGLSLRRYAALERGEFTPPPEMADQVAAALQMSEAERSALHVLATGQDPPRPVARPVGDPPHEPSSGLRDLVIQMDPNPAALTDETWTVVYYNRALAALSGGWYDAADPEERHLVSYLFSKNAEELLPDVHALRRYGLAVMRYQYTRNLVPKFTDFVRRLTSSSAEAAALWAAHEVAFPPHEYPVRVRDPGRGIFEAHVVFVPISPRLWLYTVVLPDGLRPPR